MSTEADPIAEAFSDHEPFEIAEAVKTLLPIPKQAEDTRSYLHQLHRENGYLVGTDAHVLAALPVDENGEPKDYPAPDAHKTDSIRPNGDGESLEVVCTHQNDKSGTITPVPCSENDESFPDVESVWPDSDEKLRVRVNPEYLSKILEIIGDGSDESGVVLAFCREHGDDNELDGLDAASPIKIEGPNGVGLVMPLRLQD